MCGRGIGFDQFEQCESRLFRISWLLSALGNASGPDWFEDGVVVRDRSRGAGHRAAGPIGPHLARLQCCNVDTEALELLTQGRRNALQGKLASAVIGDAGHRNETAHRSDVDDVTLTTLAHVR